MDRGVKQKTYKDLKKEIVNDTALNVGYYPKVINEINYELLLDTIKELSLNGWINRDTDTQDIANMLVTESVRNMSYQEFKDIADNFFSFVPDDEEKYYKASKLEITRENYDYLINNTKKAFGLEKKLEEIEKEKNSLDNKILSLETKLVKNKDEVVGIDLDKEEILLLKAPINVYIDEDIIAEKVINDYRSNKEDHTQILEYLTENYKEIKLIHDEYVLNNDTYRGLIDINPTDIYEIVDGVEISNFKTHKEYYDYASNFNSFNEQYSSYEDYISKRFNYIYELEYIPDYSKEILNDKAIEISNILEKNNKHLIIKDVYGYSQNEKWTIGYLADKDEDIETVETYIDNYLGAWLKGSLTELQIIPFSSFDKENNIAELDLVYYIDDELLYYDNKLEQIQEIYPELNNFKPKKEVIELLEKQAKEEKQMENKEKGISL